MNKRGRLPSSAPAPSPASTLHKLTMQRMVAQLSEVD